MTQPADPPLSLRLPKPLMAEVEAWAKRKGLSRNAAVGALLRRGLDAEAPAKVAKVEGLQVGFGSVAPGSRLKKR